METVRTATEGGIDQRCLQHVLGYQLSLADIPVKQTFFRHIGKPLGLRPVEFTILVLVAFNAGITQKPLAQALSLSAPNITLLIDRLAERGWLERVRSESDRRAQRLHLTPKGQALAQRAYEISKTMEDEMLEPLSAAERAMLIELLRKVSAPRG